MGASRAREAARTYGHDGRRMVGVRELRQHLSVYLDEVKQGHAYTVTEHGQEVAVLRPVVRSESVLDRLVAEGKAVAPQRPMRDLPAPVTIALESPLSQVLRQMRDEERW